MNERGQSSGSLVTAGPAFAELPPRPVKRWSPQRKFRVVSAVDGGAISLGDICELYGVSLEEYLEWQAGVHSQGFRGVAMRERRRGPA